MSSSSPNLSLRISCRHRALDLSEEGLCYENPYSDGKGSIPIYRDATSREFQTKIDRSVLPHFSAGSGSLNPKNRLKPQRGYPG